MLVTISIFTSMGNTSIYLSCDLHYRLAKKYVFAFGKWEVGGVAKIFLGPKGGPSRKGLGTTGLVSEAWLGSVGCFG